MPAHTSACVRVSGHINILYKYATKVESVFNCEYGDKREHNRQVSLDTTTVEMLQNRKIQVPLKHSLESCSLFHFSRADMGFCRLVYGQCRSGQRKDDGVEVVDHENVYVDVHRHARRMGLVYRGPVLL